MSRYDVVIIGSGYAGLACATRLPGRSVLVLEKNPSVVEKYRGGFGAYLPIGDDIEAYGKSVFLEGLGLHVEGGLLERIERLEIRGYRERYSLDLKKPIILLNERRIKGALYRRALEVGVDVVVDSPVREVSFGQNFCKVRSNDDFEARVLVGADGSQSLVAHQLNLNRDKIAVLFQREAEVDMLDLAPRTMLVQVDAQGHWYVAMPYNGRYLVSVIQVLSPKGVPSNLDKLLLDRIERLDGSRCISIRTSIVKILEPSPVSYKDNVILAGDSVSAYGFSSISGALTQGSMAGASVSRFLAGSSYAFPDYEKKWRKATAQNKLELLKWLFPLGARVGAHRVDRAISTLTLGNSDGPWGLFTRAREIAALLRLFL